MTSLVLPIVIPVSLIPFGINNAISAILIFSLVFGVIPYLVMCVGIIVWARDKNERDMRRLSYFAPLLYIIVLAASLLVLTVLTSGAAFQAKEYLAVLALFSIYAVVVGYIYVLLINLVYELTLSKYEDIAPTNASSRGVKSARGWKHDVR